MFVIPVLALFTLAGINGYNSLRNISTWELIAYMLIIILALIGYIVMRRHPISIVKLRRDIENMIGHVAPARATDIIQSRDDVKAIETCMGVMVDELKNQMTAIKQIESLLQQKLLLAEKMGTIDIMVSRVMHDFNNVIAVILGNASIVERNLPKDSSDIEHLKQIEKSATGAIDFIKKMHSYSGKDRYSSEAIDVSNFVKNISNTLATVIHNNVSIEYNLMDNPPPFIAGADMLREAVTNLVINASEAMQDNGGTVTISTGTIHCDKEYLDSLYFNQGLSEGDHVFVQVADTGKGMSNDEITKIFDPFFTTKIRGSGLGACCVIGVIRAAGGAISINSNPGSGSTLTMIFPQHNSA